MTFMSHFLVRLDEDQRLRDLGANWQDQVSIITPLDFVSDRYTAPDWLQPNPNHQLAWGASIWELNKADIRRLLGARPEFDRKSMADLRRAEQTVAIAE